MRYSIFPPLAAIQRAVLDPLAGWFSPLSQNEVRKKPFSFLRNRDDLDRADGCLLEAVFQAVGYLTLRYPPACAVFFPYLAESVVTILSKHLRACLTTGTAGCVFFPSDTDMDRNYHTVQVTAHPQG